jgi:hypothetical protein
VAHRREVPTLVTVILCTARQTLAPTPAPDPLSRIAKAGNCHDDEGERAMNPVRILAIALVVAGALGLAYGSFSYTKETHEAKLGPLELSVKDNRTVNVPVWAGVGSIVLGGLLLLFANKSS